MSRDWDYGKYWKNHRYIWQVTWAFTFMTIMFALPLFTNVLSRTGPAVRNAENKFF